MKNIFKSFWFWIKGHKFWSAIIILVIIGFVWYFAGNGSDNIKSEEVVIIRGPISEIVSVTGNVKPLSDVDLAFERGGRVANIKVAVGDRVYAGQILASVSNADLSANLDQAKANLKKVQAGLGDSADKTALDFTQAQNSLADTIRDSYTKADDAVRNKIFSLFNDPVKYRAKLAFIADNFLQEDIEEGKDDLVDSLDSWYRILTRTEISKDLENNYALARNNLLSVKSLLDKSAEAVNGLSAEAANTTQTQIDTWKLNISTARTNINTAINTLNSSYDQYKAAALAKKISQNSTLAEEANVEQAQATVASAEAELAKTIILSPLTGIITRVDTKLGEIVSTGKNILSVISSGGYEVESFVPEADIAKIKIGNLASTTLDAYGSNVNFETVVIKIDPAATVIDGVPTYKVTLKFTTADERIRSGMTANLDILTNQKDGVLLLPSRMIVTKDDGKYVSVIDPINEKALIEKKVATGLRGSDGNVEIISGLEEGEKVVSSIK